MSAPIGSNPNPVSIPVNQPETVAQEGTNAQAATTNPIGPVDGYESVTQPIDQVLQNLGLASSGQGSAANLSPAQQAQLSQIAQSLTSTPNEKIQSDFATMIQSGPTIDYQDVNALVQQVLREAYSQNTEDLRMYAEKVKHFNSQKEMIRDHVSDMRKFNTGAREHAVSVGITDMDDPGSWTAEQVGQMQAYFAENSSNGVAAAAYTMAHNQSVDACVDRAQNLINNAYGCDLPPEIVSELSNALESKDPQQIRGALTMVAGYLSYLGDCSVKDGQFGAGQGYDDVDNITDVPTYQDFQHYMTGDANKVARTNLAAGDVVIIEAAFGVDLGISGTSSVQDVVNAAMSPVNDKWAHEILHDRNISTSEINADLATNGPTGDLAQEIFGSTEAAVQAYWGGPLDSADPDTKMRMELNMSNGVPGPGCATIAQVEDEIKTWEDKLNSVGDDAQLANVDLQNMLQKQQQTLQMMSNISKALHDTAMAVIRKMGG